MEQDNGKDRGQSPASGTRHGTRSEAGIRVERSGSGTDRPTNGALLKAGRNRDASAYRSTEDEQLLNRPMPDEPVPRSAEMGAFTHTDPWRVLRIQGEFVHGINAAGRGRARP